MTCAQVERVLSGVFPQLQVLPFGSSVNGCGRNGCDLDIVVWIQGNQHVNPKSPFVFHAKAALENSRSQAQRNIDTISAFLHNYATGLSLVSKVLQARVPISKFTHAFTGVELDLSMSTM